MPASCRKQTFASFDHLVCDQQKIAQYRQAEILAVLRLTRSWNLVGTWTGRSRRFSQGDERLHCGWDGQDHSGPADAFNEMVLAEGPGKADR